MYKAGGNDHHARDFLELEKCLEASSLASTPYHASHSKDLLTDCTPTLDAGSPTDGTVGHGETCNSCHFSW
jgi:hypothetical protein